MGDDHCPECGGELYEGTATQAYNFRSCLECDYYTYVKTGTYHDPS